MMRRRWMGIMLCTGLALVGATVRAQETTQADKDKAQAPEPLVPTNRFGSPEGSLKHFVESRVTTEDFLKKTPDLRAHAADSPLGSKLDAYEWVLFIAAHSQRHTKQIEEVKADPNFPKK